MAEQTITIGDALGLIGWVIGIAIVIIGGLASLIVTLVFRNAERTSSQRDHQGRDVARATERTHDRSVDAAIDLSKLDANVTMLMSDRGKCDELASKVAVLEDFKGRAEGKFSEIDEVSHDLRGLSEQMKSAFKQMEGLPKAITNEVLSRIPQAVLETLAAARGLNPQQLGSPGRAANG